MDQPKNKRNPILIALDTPTLDEAKRIVEQTRQYAGGYKIGLELCSSEGTLPVIRAISALGGSVFLDLKFKYIPATVGNASKVVAVDGVLMFNVHCDGGMAMMSAAKKAAEESAAHIQPKVIGVTVLTSIGQQELNDEVGVPGDVESAVLRLASNAKSSGLDGVVCSPQEISALRQALGAEFLLVTPGIRPEWAAAGDQKRIMTPEQAVQAGASYIVIGRPITAPPAKIGSSEDAARFVWESVAPYL